MTNEYLSNNLPDISILPKDSPFDTPVGGVNVLTPASLIRTFDTGANRSSDTGKLDYEGFYSFRVMKAFATYMNFNRHLPDGSLRDSDNWQKGIPLANYMKSGYRHFIDWWTEHRGETTKEGLVWALCGLIFNAQGYLDMILKSDPTLLDKALKQNQELRDATNRTNTSTP